MSTEKPILNRDFIVEVQDREFVTYAGLLDYAHQLGLSAIETTLVQAPDEANGQMAIVHATVTMAEAATGVARRFDGYGDATPQNVSARVSRHLLRVAETRAKARALRDATNIAMVALEELGGDEPEGEAPIPRPAPPARLPDEPRRAPRPATQAHTDTMSQTLGKSAPAASPQTEPPADRKVTPSQLGKLRWLGGQLGLRDDALLKGRLAALLGHAVEHVGWLTKAEASHAIDALTHEMATEPAAGGRR